LLAHPDLWPAAIEEMMRFESPVTQGFRHVVEDVELPSDTVPAGTSAVDRIPEEVELTYSINPGAPHDLPLDWDR
jgi:hypothetical protein